MRIVTVNLFQESAKLCAFNEEYSLGRECFDIVNPKPTKISFVLGLIGLK